MAKFSFHKEQFKTNDPVWKAEREALFEKLLPIIGSSKKAQNASLKRYFIKGEWTLHSEYDLDFVTKLSFLPELKKEHYFSVMKEVPWEDGKREFRHVFLYWLMAGSQLNELSISDTLIDDFYTLSVDGLTHYSEESIEIEGITHERFPWHVDREQTNGFFMRYLSVAHEWLTEKHNQSKSGLTHFMPHWFSALSYLKWKGFTKGGMRKRILELFTVIQHYIPEHKSNPAAAQKQLFVDEFKRWVSEHGLVKPELIEIWQEASENTEEKWVEHIYESNKKDDPEAWLSYESGAFTPLCIRDKKSIDNPCEKIVSILTSNNFVNANDVLSAKRIELTHLLTPECLAEYRSFDINTVEGELTRIKLNDRFVGTDKAEIYFDIIKVTNLPNETATEVPRVWLLERPDNHYVTFIARKYCANRSYLVDALKYESGYQLVRYFGYTFDPIRPRALPVQPGDFARYSELMVQPFYNCDYLPFVFGTTAFLINANDDYVYLY
jgi:hypothetical protein